MEVEKIKRRKYERKPKENPLKAYLKALTENPLVGQELPIKATVVAVEGDTAVLEIATGDDDTPADKFSIKLKKLIEIMED